MYYIELGKAGEAEGYKPPKAMIRNMAMAPMAPTPSAVHAPLV